MSIQILRLSVLSLTLACVACTTVGRFPQVVTAVPNGARNEMSALAVRGPHPPTLNISGDNVARRKHVVAVQALEGGGGSVYAGFQLGEETGNPLGFMIFTALGIALAPVAATGGAIYGASISDNDEQIEQSVPQLRAALDRAPEHLTRQLERHLSAAGPGGPGPGGPGPGGPGPGGLRIELVDPATSNQALRAQGFDAVLDVHMDGLETTLAENQAQVSLYSRNTATLTDLDDDQLLVTRSYSKHTDYHKFSAWVADGATPMFEELDQAFDAISADLVADFFVDPSVEVEGLEPVAADAMRRGRIDSLKPLILWRTRDGNRPIPQGSDIEYEVLVYTGSTAPAEGVRTPNERFVPEGLLESCERYRWKVRAHYQAFGQPAVSPWSPEYRFGTPCKKRRDRKS